VTVTTFIVCIAVGSGAIALWINLRFPTLMPWSMKKLLAHMLVAFVCVYAVKPGIGMILGSGVPAARLIGVFVVAFPALVYNFLVCAWMIRLAQATGGGFRV
jgi:hypothetical protein